MLCLYTFNPSTSTLIRNYKESVIYDFLISGKFRYHDDLYRGS